MGQCDITYCASTCRNYDCPRHQVNAPDCWQISYAQLHRDCDEFIPYDAPDELPEELSRCHTGGFSDD